MEFRGGDPELTEVGMAAKRKPEAKKKAQKTREAKPSSHQKGRRSTRVPRVAAVNSAPAKKRLPASSQAKSKRKIQEKETKQAAARERKPSSSLQKKKPAKEPARRRQTRSEKRSLAARQQKPRAVRVRAAQSPKSPTSAVKRGRETTPNAALVRAKGQVSSASGQATKRQVSRDEASPKKPKKALLRAAEKTRPVASVRGSGAATPPPVLASPGGTLASMGLRKKRLPEHLATPPRKTQIERRAEREAREQERLRQRAERLQLREAQQRLREQERARELDARRERVQEERRVRQEAKEKQKALAQIQRAVRAAERQVEKMEAAERKAASLAERRAAEVQQKAERERAKEEERARARGAKEAARRAQIETQARERIERQEKQERAAAVRQMVDEQLRHEVREWGAPLAALFQAAVDLFAQRPDVHVELCEWGGGRELEALGRNAASLTGPLLACATRFSSLAFSWKMPSVSAKLCGSIELPEVERLAAEIRLVEGASETAAFSAFLLERLEGKGLSGEARAEFQLVGADHSLFPLTPQTQVLDAVVALGIDPKLAKALVAWLGDRIFDLMHEGATSEGRRRRACQERAESGGLPPGILNAALLAELREGPPLDRAQFKQAQERHQAFLGAVSGQGEFLVSIRQGLPCAQFSGGRRHPGQLRVAMRNLGGLKCGGLDLSLGDFCGVIGREQNFSRSRLVRACFAHADLAYTNFSSADLKATDFSGADLSGADFRKADLTGTNFEGANLAGAQFAGAITVQTRFFGANVRGIRY